jgi:hypothetical protein
MYQRVSQVSISVISVVLAGAISPTMAANLVVEQKATQEARIFGQDNQIEQVTQQFASETFVLNPNFHSQSWWTVDPLAPYNAIELRQLSRQSAIVLGAHNQVRQRVQQTQVNLFYVMSSWPKPQPAASNFLTSVNLTPLSNWTSSYLPIQQEQWGIQGAAIVGQDNQIAQAVQQRLINLFLFEADGTHFPPNLPKLITRQETFQQAWIFGNGNRVEQTIEQTWWGLSLFKPAWQADDLLHLNLGGLVDPLLGDAIANALQDLVGDRNLLASPGGSPAKSDAPSSSSAKVPEPTAAFALLAWGMLGIVRRTLVKNKLHK